MVAAAVQALAAGAAHASHVSWQPMTSPALVAQQHCDPKLMASLKQPLLVLLLLVVLVTAVAVGLLLRAPDQAQPLLHVRVMV